MEELLDLSAAPTSFAEALRRRAKHRTERSLKSAVNDLEHSAVVVDILQGLSEHAERRRWQAAALFLKSWWPWHSWPLAQALATIDSDLNVHVAEFVVHLPPGWGAQPHELPRHLPLPQMLDRAMDAAEAITLLNETLGDMRVIGDSRYGSNHTQASFKKVPGVRPTWHFCSGFRGETGAVRFDLGDDAFAEFDAKVSVDGEPASSSR